MTEESKLYPGGWTAPIVPPREFQQRGYLQEVNRCFLHPLGLAMGVKLHDDDPSKDEYQVLDARDDPEGFVFGDEVDLAPNAFAVQVEQEARAKARVAKLGFIVQPAVVKS